MLVLPATLTHAEAPACLDLLRKAVAAEADAQVLVDATQLGRFDSSALAVLLALRRASGYQGKSFAVRGLAPRLRTLAGLYGVGVLLPEPVQVPTS